MQGVSEWDGSRQFCVTHFSLFLLRAVWGSWDSRQLGPGSPWHRGWECGWRVMGRRSPEADWGVERGQLEAAGSLAPMTKPT